MTGTKRLAAVLILFVLGVGMSLGLQYWTSPKGVRRGSPQRIVVASPGLVECVFAIGAGDRVVGVSQFTDFPPEAKDRPSIGGEFNPLFDRILELKPDLVLVQSKAEKLDTFCRERGIRIVHIDLETVGDIVASFETLGRLLDCGDRAKESAEHFRGEVRRRQWHDTKAPGPRVFLCTGHTPGSLRSLGTAGAARS